jgi:hypothetical protein
VIANIKEADIFAIHLKEWTDITGKAQLLAFIRLVCNGDIIKHFLICASLPETTKGQDSLDAVDSYISSEDLSWKACISICTDVAPSMSGSLKWFVELAKQTKTGIVFAQKDFHFTIISTWGPESIGWDD